MSPLWLKWFSGSTKDENTKFKINTDNSVRQLKKVTLYLSIHVNLKDDHKIPMDISGFSLNNNFKYTFIIPSFVQVVSQQR